MSDSPTPLSKLVANLSRRSLLSEADKREILAWPSRPLAVNPTQVLCHPGERRRHVYFVVKGFLGRFVPAAGGALQMTAMAVAGDATDFLSLVRPHAICTLRPLSSGLVLEIPVEAIEASCRRQPAILEALWRHRAADATIMEQWAVNAGRRDARRGVAHLLCEIAVRTGSQQSPDYVPFPLTQQHIADALAMTSVHASRVITALRAERLADVRRGELRILDWERLAGEAKFDRAYLDG